MVDRAVRIAALVLAAGCGRVGFDARVGVVDAHDGGGDDATTARPGLSAIDCTAMGVPPVCTGLVALLHFDNDPNVGESSTVAHDYSGRGNHATCTPPNCPTWVAGGGRFGDGAFAYTEPDAFAMANAPSLSITGAVTMSAWFLPNTLATNWRIIITKIQTTPLIANYGLPHNGTQMCVNFCTSGGGWQNHCTPTDPSFVGHWHHLVGVVDSTNGGATLYLDGVRVLDDPEVMPMEQDGGQVWIGWSPTNFGVDGRIDEVAIWNRALSASEIAALY